MDVKREVWYRIYYDQDGVTWYSERFEKDVVLQAFAAHKSIADRSNVRIGEEITYKRFIDENELR